MIGRIPTGEAVDKRDAQQRADRIRAFREELAQRGQQNHRLILTGEGSVDISVGFLEFRGGRIQRKFHGVFHVGAIR